MSRVEGTQALCAPAKAVWLALGSKEMALGKRPVVKLRPKSHYMNRFNRFGNDSTEPSPGEEPTMDTLGNFTPRARQVLALGRMCYLV
jgi:hypothetical protein